MRVGPLLRCSLVALAVLLLALLAVACDGDGGGSVPEAETPVASATAPANGTPGTDKDVEDLRALGAKSADAIAAVTYRYTADLKDPTAQTVEGEWVLVRRPPEVRFETRASGASRTIIISSGGKRYVCSSATGKEQCLASSEESSQDPTATLAPFFDVPRQIAASPAEVSPVSRSERTIAGHDATCFTTPAGLAGVGSMCLTGEGIILFLSIESGQGTFTFEAASVSKDVTDEDFKPPYPVVEAPSS